MLFHIVEDAQVVLRARGVYRQEKLFRNGHELYAGWGKGFIRLAGRGGTSHPHASWLGIIGVPWIKGRMDAPVLSEGYLGKLVAIEGSCESVPGREIPGADEGGGGQPACHHQPVLCQPNGSGTKRRTRRMGVRASNLQSPAEG